MGSAYPADTELYESRLSHQGAGLGKGASLPGLGLRDPGPPHFRQGWSPECAPFPIHSELTPPSNKPLIRSSITPKELAAPRTGGSRRASKTDAN